MVCLTLTGNTLEENTETIRKYREYIDLLEVRLDFLRRELLSNMGRIRDLLPLPAIATFRRENDGGQYTGSEEYRVKKLTEAVEAGFAYVDIEYDLDAPALVQLAEEKKCRIIRSFHSFSGIPDNLEDIILKTASLGNSIPKAAVYPRTSAEALKLLRIIKNMDDIKEKIILGMGDFGFFTRILYRKLGSLLTFCSGESNGGAPGHITPRELRYTFNIDRITSSAAVYGIIGNPVMHSLSPQLHNKGYRKYDLDTVYVPFPVTSVSSFLEFARELDIKGFSVTVPYKQTILPFLVKRDHRTAEAGACNTVLVTGEGLEGWNTDVDGFLEPLRRRLSFSSIRKTAVIGAGGAAAAVVEALKEIDTEIHVFNRTLSKAALFAEKFGVFYHSLDSYRKIAECDLIVQTTSVGMSPDVSKTPVPGYRFSEHQVAYDIIYTPSETVFLKEARNSGCRTINGMEMLVAQGKRQFELFTGMPYPETGA